HYPDERRDTTFRVLVMAECVQRVLFHRRILAGVSTNRFLEGAARFPAAAKAFWKMSVCVLAWGQSCAATNSRRRLSACPGLSIPVRVNSRQRRSLPVATTSVSCEVGDRDSAEEIGFESRPVRRSDAGSEPFSTDGW